jgi:hypothetical protein
MSLLKIRLAIDAFGISSLSKQRYFSRNTPVICHDNFKFLCASYVRARGTKVGYR